MPTVRTSPPRRLRVVGCGVAIAIGSLISGCGGEELNRTDFLSLTTQGDGGLSRPVANCVFDRVSGDELVLGELRDKGPRSTELSDAVNTKMETFVAECILEANDADAEGDEPDRTTTTQGEG